MLKVQRRIHELKRKAQDRDSWKQIAMKVHWTPTDDAPMERWMDIPCKRRYDVIELAHLDVHICQGWMQDKIA